MESAQEHHLAAGAVIVECTYAASRERVWTAITDRTAMKEWYFDLEQFTPQPGFEFRFYGGPEDREYLHVCRVVTAVPREKLSYTWRYDGYEGATLVTFELFEEDGTTRLRLTHEGLESFPADNPDFARQNFLEGWTALITTALKNHLEPGR